MYLSLDIDDDNERIFRSSSRGKSEHYLEEFIIASYLRIYVHFAEIKIQRTLDLDRFAHSVEFYYGECIRRLGERS